MSSYKVSNPELFRESIRTALSQMLFLTMTDHPTNIRIIINLERGIYNYAIQEARKRNIIRKWENVNFLNLYINRLRSIYLNLKNDEFASKIKNGDISSERVAFMTHQEYLPDRWQLMMEEKAMRQASKFNTDIQASTDVYQCKRCKSRKCIYSEQQVRSADESMTIFVTCLDCGKQWKC